MNTTTLHHLAAAVAVFAATVSNSLAGPAEPAETLWFADSQVSAFYAVDAVNHRVVLITKPGPQGREQASRTEKQLVDGEQVAISLSGQADNALTATLAITRTGQGMDVQITSRLQEHPRD